MRRLSFALAIALTVLALGPATAQAHYSHAGMRDCGFLQINADLFQKVLIHAKGTPCRWAVNLAWDVNWHIWRNCDRYDECSSREVNPEWRADAGGVSLRKYRCESRRDESRRHDEEHIDRVCWRRGDARRTKVVMEWDLPDDGRAR